MRLFGYELSVNKAAGSSGVVNREGSARLQDIARETSRAGTATPAYGTRPTPGAIPTETDVEADPLRFQFPWGGNLTYTPRTGYGTPFSILRNLATAPVIALCIQCRKDQMEALDWDFAPRDKKNKGTQFDAKVKQAREFFAKPDHVTPFKTWLQTLVDETLTVDALSIYRRRTRGGAPYGYEIIDGGSIQVLLDERGFLPQPPQIAYRQIIYGAPMTGGDCTTDDLLYRPKTVRTWTPYGCSPIESALLLVTADLNRTVFNLSYYTDGNIPEALVGVPNTWSPKQIQQFNEYWDVVLKGDPKNRNRLRFVVETMAKTVHEFKKPDFTTAYDLWLLKLQCACFGVTPSEIGFTDDVNRATSKTQGDVNQRRGVKPMATYIKAILDEMLIDLGWAELEATWKGGEGEDALSQAKITDLNLRNGREQLDEVRAEDGRPALGLGPGLVTATGFVSFTEPTPSAAPKAPATPTPPTDSAAQQAELKKFQTVALKAVKAGKSVPVFTSAILPTSLHAQLTRTLAAVTSVDEVKAAFTEAVTKAEGRQLSAAQLKQQRTMAKTLTRVFSDEREAFARHLEHGLREDSAKQVDPVLAKLDAIQAQIEATIDAKLSRFAVPPTQGPAPSVIVKEARAPMHKRVEYNDDGQIIAIHEELADPADMLKRLLTPSEERPAV